MESKQSSLEWLEATIKSISVGRACISRYQEMILDLVNTAKAIQKEEQKRIAIATYVQIKMERIKVLPPYGFAYFDKLSKVEADAEKWYSKMQSKYITDDKQQ